MDAMELRSRQLWSNFRGLFTTSPSSVLPNASNVSQVIFNTPPSTTTGTQTPPTVMTQGLSTFRQASLHLTTTIASSPITDTLVILQRQNYTTASTDGTKTVAASSYALSSNNNIDRASSLAAQAQPNMSDVIRWTNYNQYKEIAAEYKNWDNAKFLQYRFSNIVLNNMSLLLMYVKHM